MLAGGMGDDSVLFHTVPIDVAFGACGLSEANGLPQNLINTDFGL
jgi:hypothetical protein